MSAPSHFIRGLSILLFTFNQSRLFSSVKGYYVHMINVLNIYYIFAFNSKRNSISTRAHVLFSMANRNNGVSSCSNGGCSSSRNGLFEVNFFVSFPDF